MAAAIFLVLVVAASGVLPGTRVAVVVNACNGCGFLLQWGSWGTSKGQFYNPYGVAVDASGNVYVADSNNNRVEKFTSTGTFITAWGSTGSGIGQFIGLWGVAVDSSGNVYVTEMGNNRVEKFTSAGTYVAKWGYAGGGNGNFTHPHGIAVDASGNVYVADYGYNRVEKFTSTGTWQATWSSFSPYPPPSPGSFKNPTGVAVDASGNVYVADTGHNVVEKFDGSGGLLTVWGGSGSGPGQFNSPQGVAVDSSGNVYVVDLYNDRVEKFDSSGTFLAALGSPGGVPGQFNGPYAVAVDSLGNVYVTDVGNNRVELFGDSSPLNSGATLVSLSLVTGWNLISLPVVPFSNSISFVLAGLIAAGNLSIVWSYQTVCTTKCAQAWLMFQPPAPSPCTTTLINNQLCRMADGFGYWIYATQPSTLKVLGYVIPPGGNPPSYPLVAGWNMLGFKPQPTVGNETVSSYLGDISGTYTIVGIYDNLNQTWVHGAANYTLSPGQAMWVYMTVPATLILPI